MFIGIKSLVPPNGKVCKLIIYTDSLVSVQRGIPFDIIFFILLLKHLIMQILCQGSINYLLQVNNKKNKK